MAYYLTLIYILVAAIFPQPTQKVHNTTQISGNNRVTYEAARLMYEAIKYKQNTISRIHCSSVEQTCIIILNKQSHMLSAGEVTLIVTPAVWHAAQIFKGKGIDIAVMSRQKEAKVIGFAIYSSKLESLLFIYKGTKKHVGQKFRVSRA